MEYDKKKIENTDNKYAIKFNKTNKKKINKLPV